jgi:sulfatase modifying factor 1
MRCNAWPWLVIAVVSGLGCGRASAREAGADAGLAVAPLAVAVRGLDAGAAGAVAEAGVEGAEGAATGDGGGAAPGQRSTPTGDTAGCPEGMVSVRGQYCPEVEQECLEMMADGYQRCARFREPSVCRARRRSMAFCIDRYEWPNRRGERPVVWVNWHEAAAQCASRGARLCGEHEWTFACEGEAMLPYPYGYVRDSEACNIDRLARRYDRAALRRGGATAQAEIERVWMGEVSGARDRCVSPFGVHDMAGNIDEWTVSSTGVPFQSALKGGWWSRVRTRCRPVTRAHYERFRYYQIGFRCCADAR